MVSWAFGRFLFCLLTDSELALLPVGKPPPPKEEEEEEKEAPGSSQEPGDREGGAQPTLLAQVYHPLPRCVLTRPRQASPGARQARNGDAVVRK